MEAGEPALTRRQFLGRGLGWGLALATASLGPLAAWFMHRFKPPRTFSSLFPFKNPYVREARYWRTSCAGVQCTLCPFQCFLPEGARGICRVRMNVGGRLVTLVYGHPVSVHIDPMEKKPVFHMLPGSLIYSLAAVGCSLRCSFCQNWEISQTFPEQAEEAVPVPLELKILGFQGGRLLADVRHEERRVFSPEEIVKAARATRCRSVAYTYSEPAVFYEYVMDTALLAKKAGLGNVLVSCGYVNPEPLAEMAPYFDVIKVDLKGFNEGFYRRVAGGELKFVLRTLVELKRLGVMTEIVNLVVHTLNDDPAETKRMCSWVLANLGPDVPIFFSRFPPPVQAPEPSPHSRGDPDQGQGDRAGVGDPLRLCGQCSRPRGGEHLLPEVPEGPHTPPRLCGPGGQGLPARGLPLGRDQDSRYMGLAL